MSRTLDQILASEKADVVANAQAKAAEMLLNIHLAELRERLNKTQNDMAQALGIKQPTIAGMEKTGSKLRIEIDLLDGSRHGFTV